MNKEEWGVHEMHCCATHGCKYGDHDCPVVAGLIEGIVCEECNAITHAKRYIEVCCCGDCPYLQNFGGAGFVDEDFRCGNQEIHQSQKIDGKFLVDGFPDFCPIENKSTLI